MKFLIAIGSREYSEPTLRIGMRVAKAFSASVTICYVGPKVRDASMNDIALAQESFGRWEMDTPGVEILEWAFNILAQRDYIMPNLVKTGFQKHTLVPTGPKTTELLLEGTFHQDLRMIIRNGNIVHELHDEVAGGNYDVTIIGGSGKRNLVHDLVQYIGSSILIVNNFNPDKAYRLLLPVDDSPGTRNAVRFGVQVARTYQLPADILTVSKRKSFGSGYQNAHQLALRQFKAFSVETESLLEIGDPVQTILRRAGQDHIIVMGVSSRNPLLKFFRLSKPLNVAIKCQCPILIVK